MRVIPPSLPYNGTGMTDLRYAIRTFYKTPAFAAAAVAALALGIGANTAVFSVVNAVLLKPLMYPDPGRIVLFFSASPAGPTFGASATTFNVWRAQTQVVQDVSAYEYRGADLNLTGGAFPEQVRAIRVSAGYFRLLGAPVALGRTFTPDEDRPSAGHTAVLSYNLWQRRFGADPRIVGRTISLDSAPYTVTGVLGPGFDTELDTPPDIWLPFQIDPDSTDHAHYFNVIARLKPGITLAMANARLQLAGDEFRRKFPNMIGARDSFRVEPFEDAMVSDVRFSLLALAGAVGFVLLIACANVANLLLVRAAGRRREIALRAAIGASRGRIVRQLLAESLALSIAGGALGLCLGVVGVRALLAINPGDIPRIGEHGSAIAIDWRLLAFTILISLITGVLFGLVPALDASRADLSTALKEGARSGSSARQTHTRAFLVVAETALALVLLVGAGLLIRTFVALRAVDPGFDSHNILTMRMSLAGPRFNHTSAVSQLLRNGIMRLAALPGVTAAGASYSLPLEGAFGVPFNIVGRIPANGRYDGGGWHAVSPEYFNVFRIPLLRGRAFTERDDSGSDPVAVINQAMARKFWPGGDPIGQRVLLGKGYGPEFAESERQIIGVVGDVHDFGLENRPTPKVYIPMAQVTDGITALANRAASLAWIVRSSVAPSSLRSAMNNELRQASGGLPAGHVRSMDEIRRGSTARASFNMSLLTILGCTALLLAAVGIYGMMAYSVQERTREIGIRLALGAKSADVRRMVVFEGMRLALIGIFLGIVGALALRRVITSFLFGVHAWDPLVFLAVPLSLTAVALLAVWLPALRATRINPVNALRSE
jgi:putative ABC transport system permease protein